MRLGEHGWYNTVHHQVKSDGHLLNRVGPYIAKHNTDPRVVCGRGILVILLTGSTLFFKLWTQQWVSLTCCNPCVYHPILFHTIVTNMSPTQQYQHVCNTEFTSLQLVVYHVTTVLLTYVCNMYGHVHRFEYHSSLGIEHKAQSVQVLFHFFPFFLK